MSYCRNCGHKIEPDDTFCPKCGTDQRSAGARDNKSRNPKGLDLGSTSQNSNHHRNPFIPALKTKEGIAAFDAIQDAITKRMLWLIAVALVAALILAVMLAMYSSDLIFIPIVIMVLSLVGTLSARMTESKYYTIPGSRDNDGAHRCIHCGNKGIYKHGQYKSNLEYSDCSRCNETLWKN